MIYPTNPPGGFPPGSAEGEFFRIFSALPDAYTVFYSLQLKTPEGPHREIDYLVLAPYGIFLVELKNGRYFRENERLLLRNHKGETAAFDTLHKKDPLTQLLSARDRFVSFCNSGSAVHPEVRLSQSDIRPLLFITDPESYACLSEDSEYAAVIVNAGEIRAKTGIREKAEMLEGILSANPPEKSPSAEVLRHAKSVITDRTNFIKGFKHRRKLQESEIISLTKNQTETLAGMQENPRSLIRGVAGSGKTLVLTEYARRMHRQQKDTLFLCHNSSLNAHLRRELSDCRSVTVKTMAGLCREIITFYEPDFGKRRSVNLNEEDRKTAEETQKEKESGDSSVFLKKILPEKALAYAEKYLADTRAERRYQVLIADEAQDILSETELLLLDSLTEGGLKNGNFMFAYDADQSLSGDIQEGLQYLRSLCPAEFSLDVNIRTPADIYKTAKIFTGLGGNSVLRDFIKPVFLYYSSPEEAKKILEKTVDYALRELHFSPEEILILGPREKKHTAAPGSLMQTGRISIRNVKDGLFTEGAVGYAEIKRFKGLEAPFVILTGFEDINPASDLSLIYVGMTRATAALALLMPEKMQSWVQTRFAAGLASPPAAAFAV